MAGKRRSTGKIIAALREAQVWIGQGETIGKICRSTVDLFLLVLVLPCTKRVLMPARD